MCCDHVRLFPRLILLPSAGGAPPRISEHTKLFLHLSQYKVWVKPSAEMSFLYGNHVQKSGLGRITENTPKYGGAVVYSMSDVPLGFGVAAQPTEYCKDLDPTAVVVLHQADVGEYLRVEDDLL